MADAGDEAIILKIGGQIMDKWSTLGFDRSFDTVCSRFEVGMANPVGSEIDLSAIADMAPFQLYLGDDTPKNLIMTGYVDKISDGVGKELRIGGRDKTGDLIDCAAIHTPGWWRNQKLEAITAELLKPFGLTLRVDNPTGAPFPTFALEHGESVMEAILRMCHMRGMMVRTDPDATLVFFTPSGRRAAFTFELGRNLEDFGIEIDSSQRFSQYVLKGQSLSGQFVSAKDAAQPSAEASDPGVTRYRPLMIISQEQATLAGLKSRAAWEATVRKGRALKVSCAVKGWRDDNGALFEPDTIGKLLATQKGLDLDMTISSVAFSRDKAGTLSSFSLCPPSAFTTETLLEPKKKKHKKGLDYGAAYN